MEKVVERITNGLDQHSMWCEVSVFSAENTGAYTL